MIIPVYDGEKLLGIFNIKKETDIVTDERIIMDTQLGKHKNLFIMNPKLLSLQASDYPNFDLLGFEYRLAEGYIVLRYYYARRDSYEYIQK